MTRLRHPYAAFTRPKEGMTTHFHNITEKGMNVRIANCKHVSKTYICCKDDCYRCNPTSNLVLVPIGKLLRNNGSKDDHWDYN
jgi:hypothetical protein